MAWKLTQNIFNMTRKKIRHVEIPSEITRKSILNKRRESLFKKANELSTLCDVNVALIVQDLKQNDEVLWPSHEDVEEKVRRFINMPDFERYSKSKTQANYLSDLVENKYQNVAKFSKKNDQRESGNYIFKLSNQSITAEKFDMRQTNGLINLFSIVTNMLGERKQEFDKLKQ
ncbi:agamous-like MADS-box protein AGL80 [Coffea eugenioides]|uniref:agamous-like MADS-box protein AGL80 n=1 Tax=Coffea eugenioides TaxID=49369 RepID=UPI000F60B578|nr:agamous-like MADS-box protein AGL80 [Coffea eugenioides]